MKRTCLYFTAPCQVSLVEEVLAPPGAGQALVETWFSAISPGTESLVYRGHFPGGLAVDASLPSLAGEFAYPLKYGYCTVGRVTALGPQVDRQWQNRLVFAFQPHQSHFVAPLQELFPLPEDVPPQAAVFLPNMETAVNFVMDGAPLIGEKVAVFGQGIVGLLTTALLAQFPLERLITLDRYASRRQRSLTCGAYASLDPQTSGLAADLAAALGGEADLVFELSGAPAALDQAIQVTGFAGRIVIGSWYGQKEVHLNLGGRFHRSRIQLISSQVSSLAPTHTGRWSKARRFALAWEMIRQIGPQRWITQQVPLAEAARAYRSLDQDPEASFQPVLVYPPATFTGIP